MILGFLTAIILGDKPNCECESKMISIHRSIFFHFFHRVKELKGLFLIFFNI